MQKNVKEKHYNLLDVLNNVVFSFVNPPLFLKALYKEGFFMSIFLTAP